MKKAIVFLRSKGIEINDEGFVSSIFPDGIKGIELLDELEEITKEDDFYYTIINDRITKMEY